MDKLVGGDAESRTLDIIAENRDRLKALFPEVFSEGMVDFDILKQILGATTGGQVEKYGLDWHGKRQARQLALTPSTGTLRPCLEDSVDWDVTKNLMIEGDNLEVLKVLQKSYAGKVKLIYIDPPYNTGNDFVYSDNYHDNLRNYLTLTGQVDEASQKLSSNTDTSGRFHTAWLNMMYPRLLLARQMLNSEGVILISIDDFEVHNLRVLCDDIFGTENFCGTFVWEKKKKPAFLDRNMGSVTDYIVAYAKARDRAPPFVAGSVEVGKKYPFNNAGNSISVLRFPALSVTFSCADQLVPAQNMSEGNIVTELLDDMRIKDGVNENEFRLRGEWRYSQKKLDEFVSANAEILISKVPFRPNYINRSGEAKKTSNLLSHRVNGIPTNEDGTQEMRNLFGADVMSYPKPHGLIAYLVRAITAENDIILDFFAGSGTTAGGVWQQTFQDGLPRRFILVQLPEPLDQKKKEQQAATRFLEHVRKPLNIAELTKEYLRRMAKNLYQIDSMFTGDLGFRAFRLDSTNIREWEADAERLEVSLELNIESLKTDRTEKDILYELFLKLGFDLCTPIEVRKISGKQVYSVDGGMLFACLESRVTTSDSEILGHQIASWHDELSPGGEATCVFRDNAFADDVAKVNLTHFLLERGFSSVRSI